MKTAEKWVEESLRCGGMFDNVGLDDAEALVEAIQKDALNTDSRTDKEKAAGSRRLAMMILNRTPFRLKLVQNFSQEDGLMIHIEQDLHGKPFEVTTLEPKEATKEAPEGEGEMISEATISKFWKEIENYFDEILEDPENKIKPVTAEYMIGLLTDAKETIDKLEAEDSRLEAENKTLKGTP